MLQLGLFYSAGDFTAHVCNDCVICRDVIRTDCFSDLNLSGVLLLDFCASLDLVIINTIFKRKGAYTCM